MRQLFLGAVAAAALLAAPLVARAGDVALIVANTFYDHHPNARENRALLNLVPDLEAAGFEVLAVRNLRSDAIRAELSGLVPKLRSEGRKLFILGGHFVRDSRNSWLLLSDADRPDGFEIGRYGLSMGEILDLAAANPGEAIVAVAPSEAEVQRAFGIGDGFKGNDIPQGVTLLAGPPQGLSDYIAREVLRPGTVLRDTARRLPDGVTLRGFLPRSAPFLPAGQAPAETEQAFWQRVLNANTADAYEDYLERYPNGRYAAEARARADELRLTPLDRARLGEEALGLSRDQRRAIQRNLTLIGFDTFGVDGIFGNRTRTAVANWQQSIGVPVSGYLTANQIARLDVAAAARAEELQREAEERRLAEERADRAFWNQTGASGTEEGLRAYLWRYPDGLYSAHAEARLRAIEREKRRLAEAEEREAWDRAVMAGTLESYQRYLQDYPSGRFVEEARARVASLSEPETPPAVVAAAKAEEARLNLNGFTRQLIEAHLAKLNFEPGPADGNFTGETRRALRRFQRANSLDVTGFVTRQTIVLLLASAVEN